MLNNLIIYRGAYEDIRVIREKFKQLQENKKNSPLYNENTTKYLKKIQIIDEYQEDYLYELKISFQYKKSNYKELLETLKTPNAELAHMCWDAKDEVWVVNSTEYIEKYRFIPEFALHKILLEYMSYTESAIILDSYETIKFDHNTRRVVVNDRNVSYEDLLDIVFTKKIKGKPLYSVIEPFVINYYSQCINQYDGIFSSSSESIPNNEEPSPLALFIVTVGIIAIIVIALKILKLI